MKPAVFSVSQRRSETALPFNSRVAKVHYRASALPFSDFFFPPSLSSSSSHFPPTSVGVLGGRGFSVAAVARVCREAPSWLGVFPLELSSHRVITCRPGLRTCHACFSGIVINSVSLKVLSFCHFMRRRKEVGLVWE